MANRYDLLMRVEIAASCSQRSMMVAVGQAQSVAERLGDEGRELEKLANAAYEAIKTFRERASDLAIEELGKDPADFSRIAAA